MHNDPIDAIVWRAAVELKPNFYNPNVVFNEELSLLEFSLLKTGWMQPILINSKDIIIDGFHRWRLAQDSKKLMAKYSGQVPCAVVEIGERESIMMTVRINRAKGTRVAVRMSNLIKILIDEHKCEREEVAQGIGATLEEVDLLYQDSIFKAKNLDGYKYSQAWVPRRRNPNEQKADTITTERAE